MAGAEQHHRHGDQAEGEQRGALVCSSLWIHHQIVRGVQRLTCVCSEMRAVLAAAEGRDEGEGGGRGPAGRDPEGRRRGTGASLRQIPAES